MKLKLPRMSVMDLSGVVGKLAEGRGILQKATIEQIQDLSEQVSKATKDESGAVSIQIGICIANLVQDKWWEPQSGGVDDFGDAEACEIWDEQCESKGKYIDLALQLMGDKPAMSVTWHQILHDASYYWMLDIRNACKAWLERVGMISKEDPIF